MKNFLAIICVLILFSSSYAEWSAERTAAFIREVQIAADPHDTGKNIKSMRILTEGTILKLNIKINSETIFKIPDKMKQTVEMVGLQSTSIYFNGKEGWKIDSIGGKSPLEDAALREIIFSVKMLNPANKWTDIFDKISIADELEEYNGKKYIAVTGSFSPDKKLFPCKFLIDPDTNLTIYTFIKTTSELGDIETITHNIEFKKIHGLMMPVKSVQTVLNMQFESVLKLFTINQNYPDSVFEYKK